MKYKKLDKHTHKLSLSLASSCLQLAAESRQFFSYESALRFSLQTGETFFIIIFIIIAVPHRWRTELLKWKILRSPSRTCCGSPMSPELAWLSCASGPGAARARRTPSQVRIEPEHQRPRHVFAEIRFRLFHSLIELFIMKTFKYARNFIFPYLSSVFYFYIFYGLFIFYFNVFV